ATASSSCSSRFFITCAAASGPTMTSKAASFCTFVILETSSGAAALSAGAAMKKSGAPVVAGQPTADGLGHGGWIFFNQSVEHFDRNHAGFGLLPPGVGRADRACFSARTSSFDMADRQTERQIRGIGFLEQLEEDHQHRQGDEGIEPVLADVPVELSF